MRDSVNPALAACLYSLILIGTAYLMARQEAQRAADAEDRGPSLLRGTSVALCIVAMLLPMARVVGTTATGDLLLLGGAMVAAGAALIHLVRGNARAELTPPTRTDTSRLGARRASRPATRMPMSTRAYDVRATPRQAAAEQPAPDPEAASDGPPSAGSADLADELPQTPAGQASRTLHDVEDVVGHYAHRLGLDEPGPGASGPQRGSGTDRGSNP